MASASGAGASVSATAESAAVWAGRGATSCEAGRWGGFVRVVVARVLAAVGAAMCVAGVGVAGSSVGVVREVVRLEGVGGRGPERSVPREWLEGGVGGAEGAGGAGGAGGTPDGRGVVRVIAGVGDGGVRFRDPATVAQVRLRLQPVRAEVRVTPDTPDRSVRAEVEMVAGMWAGVGAGVGMGLPPFGAGVGGGIGVERVVVMGPGMMVWVLPRAGGA
jgi:hypothetical protein